MKLHCIITVQNLNEVIRDLEKRVDELGKEYYNTDTVRNRLVTKWTFNIEQTSYSRYLTDTFSFPFMYVPWLGSDPV